MGFTGLTSATAVVTAPKNLQSVIAWWGSRPAAAGAGPNTALTKLKQHALYADIREKGFKDAPNTLAFKKHGGQNAASTAKQSIAEGTKAISRLRAAIKKGDEEAINRETIEIERMVGFVRVDVLGVDDLDELDADAFGRVLPTFPNLPDAERMPDVAAVVKDAAQTSL